LENHNLLSVTSMLEPTILLRCVDYYYVFCSHVWYDVDFSYAMFVCVAMCRQASDRGPRYQVGGKY
jgi:capsid portal protein